MAREANTVSGGEQERRLNSESSTVTREIVVSAARDCLNAVAEAAKGELGPHPERLQRSVWMVRTKPSVMSGKEFERKVFDRASVWIMYQKQMRNGSSEQRRLGAVLAAAGIPSEETWYGFFLPLIHHWLELPDPFTFEEAGISRVLDEFVDAVVDGTVVTRSREAIGLLDLNCGSVVLEEAISIRPVAEDELWEFGEIHTPQWQFPHFLTMPSEEWKILDIRLRHVREKVFLPGIIDVLRGAVVAAVRLASYGSFQLIDLGRQVRYGTGALGRVTSGAPMPRELGRWEGAYVLDAEVAHRLKGSWPRLRKIMESGDHYLRLPAQRLVDGGARDRLADAIIDYAIGLEALLTAGITDELRYRFALRGATVLTWDGGNKEESFRELRDFYDVRSLIVHGAEVTQTELRNARSQGEKALRGVWWWYFAKGASGLKKATSMIDSRILE